MIIRMFLLSILLYFYLLFFYDSQTWSGTVVTDDNEHYTLTLPARKGSAAPISSLRFFVNFPSGGPVPRVQRIWKDGSVICGNNRINLIH
jgi:hypothetical protein